MPPKIDLLKIRDFGETISDSLTFVKENLKPLTRCFFIFCGFFLLASALSSVLQQVKLVEMANSTDFNPQTWYGSRFAKYGVEFFLSVLFAILNSIAIHVTVFSYICIYKEKGNVPPTNEEMWGYFKYFYLKILGSGILIGLLLVAATVLCIIPGVYLYPVLSLVFPIMIFENTSLGYAFNRSFKLIKDNWWLTFGALFVIYLIIYVASLIVVLPVSIINLSGLLLHPSRGLHLNSTLTIITTILQHLCQVLLMIPIVTISLIYFSLTEKMDSTGLMARISQIGITGSSDTLPPEQY